MELRVRAAIDLDIIPLMTLAKDYQEEASRWSTFSFDPDRIATLAAFAIPDPTQQIFIAYKGNEVHGFMWVAIDSPVWSKDIMGYDLFLYVPKKHRNLFTAKALVGAFEKWAKACGAKAVHTGTNSGIFNDNPAEALYSHLGYVKGGANFYKELL